MRTKATHANSHRRGIRPSLATALYKKESPQIVPKTASFLVCMNKTQILLFALVGLLRSGGFLTSSHTQFQHAQGLCSGVSVVLSCPAGWCVVFGGAG